MAYTHAEATKAYQKAIAFTDEAEHLGQATNQLAYYCNHRYDLGFRHGFYSGVAFGLLLSASW